MAVLDVLFFVYDREKPDGTWMRKFNMVIRRCFNDYNNFQILSLSSYLLCFPLIIINDHSGDRKKDLKYRKRKMSYYKGLHVTLYYYKQLKNPIILFD